MVRTLLFHSRNTGSSPVKNILKKMRLYIYILYEIFILKTTYLLTLISTLCTLSIVFLNYNTIMNGSMLENIFFILLFMAFSLAAHLILVLPYVLYIPGDGSCLESVLKNSEIPHATILVSFKENMYKKKKK